MNTDKAAIILAAGIGTRMKSNIPKVMHKIAGRSMINHVINACAIADIENITVIVGPDMDILEQAVSPYQTAKQKDRLGTAHAVMQAENNLKDFNGVVTILNGDLPFITPETIHALQTKAADTGMAILGFETDTPDGYGRLIVENHVVVQNIEHKDCAPEQHLVTLCNAGAYCVRGNKLFAWLKQISNDNAQGEYYLPDLITIAAKEGVACGYVIADECETIGVNSRIQLAEAEQIMQSKLRQKAMENGVTMIDPSSVYLSVDTVFGRDVIIEPNVVIGENVTIGDNTTIHAFSHIEGAEIGENASIGPFARIRPKSKIGNNASVGNFIEVNRSEFKDGAKSKHLSYIGDATIGEKTNIGAGTVIANYDGFNKHKSSTGKNVFIGSNSTLISPVSIGDGAMIAAGSVITKNIDNDALAVGRSKERILDGWAKKYREKNSK